MIFYFSETTLRYVPGVSKQVRSKGYLPKMLTSYHYFKKADIRQLKEELGGAKMFADSGAYSAWSLGAELKVQEYAEWLHKWKDCFEVYANLDVKGDVDAGLRNQHYLESQGLQPLPVFHGGEPWSVLQDMITDYPYIALGGLAGSGRSGRRAMWAFIIRAFKMAKGKSVYHGFGMTNIDLLAALPWYSADSTTWLSGVRYGSVPIFDAQRKRFQLIEINKNESWRKHAHLVARYGFDAGEFMNYHTSKRMRLLELSALGWMEMERWLDSRVDVQIPKREERYALG